MRLAGQVLVLTVALSGCTAIKATVHMAAAEQALAEARSRNAQNLAIYEYTMAIRYLEKAREENGSADYKISEKLAKRSAEWSDKAIISMEGGRRGIDALDTMGDDIAPATPKPLADEPLPDSDDGWQPAQPLEPLDDDEPDDEPPAGDEFDLDDDFDIEE